MSFGFMRKSRILMSAISFFLAVGLVSQQFANASLLTGYTALHFAVLGGDGRQVQNLLVSGADVNARSFRGLTPLHLAVQKGRWCIVMDLLRRADVDVNAQDDDGKTPLHFAVQNANAHPVRCRCVRNHVTGNYEYIYDNNAEIMYALLADGADIYLADNAGKSPLDYADEFGKNGPRIMMEHRDRIHAEGYLSYENKWGLYNFIFEYMPPRTLTITYTDDDVA